MEIYLTNPPEERLSVRRWAYLLDWKILENGGYTVYVLSLPGCISEGNTVEKAIKNIKEAIELYLEPVEDDLIPFVEKSRNNWVNFMSKVLSLNYNKVIKTSPKGWMGCVWR